MEAMKPDELDDAALSTAYQALESPAPSATLDAAILAAAREAVQPSATVLPFPVKPRRNWQLPLGLAASLTLAVGLSWQLQQSGEVTLDMPTAPVLQAEVAPAPLPTMEAEPSVAADANKEAEQAVVATAPVERAPASVPPAPVHIQDIAPPEAIEAPRREAAPPPPPAPPAPAMAAPAPAPAAPAPLPLTAQSSSVPVPTYFAGQKAESLAPVAEPRADKLREKISVTGSAIARPEQAEAAAPAADARRPEEARLSKRSNLAAAPVGKLAQDPEVTLQEIRRLLATHQDAAAKALLKQWREQWPDHPLPPDLQALNKAITEPAPPLP